MARAKRKATTRKPTRTRTPSKSRSKSQSQYDLEKIEHLLGEDFETLAEAKRALAKETGPVPRKKSYTVRELSTKKHRTVRTFIPDIEAHTKEIDQLKKPSDFWAAEIYGNKTYSVYGSINDLAKKLGSYRGLAEEEPQKALKNIKILRVEGRHGLEEYQARRKEQTQASWKRVKAKHKLDRKRQREQAKKMKAMAKQIAELKKKLGKQR